MFLYNARNICKCETIRGRRDLAIGASPSCPTHRSVDAERALQDTLSGNVHSEDEFRSSVGRSGRRDRLQRFREVHGSSDDHDMHIRIRPRTTVPSRRRGTLPLLLSRTQGNRNDRTETDVAYPPLSRHFCVIPWLLSQYFLTNQRILDLAIRSVYAFETRLYQRKASQKCQKRLPVNASNSATHGHVIGGSPYSTLTDLARFHPLSTSD